MKLRFVTSIPGFIEGRVIEVDKMLPEFLEYLRLGIVEAVREEPSTALAPALVEQAVTRRREAMRPRRKRKVGATADSADGAP